MPRSNLQNAKLNRAIYCTINFKIRYPWRSFLLQKGHIYGYSPELERDGLTGLFVVYQVQRNCVVLRVARQDSANAYTWIEKAITPRCETAQIIMDVNSRRIGGVEVDKWDISSFYKPKLVTDPFIPMPNMRIPMGHRDGLITAEFRRNDLNATSHKEFITKIRDRRFENILHQQEVGIERRHHV